MLYLSPICAMLHLFGHKTLIQLKCFTYYRKNLSEYCSFKIEIPIQILYLKCPNLLSPLIKTALENCIFTSKSLKGLLPSSIYVWNHLQSCHQNVIFHQLRANKLKEILITFSLNRYN